ncbi:MAG: lipopolysaccharide kinase InaA family protein, partial [Verrucomicrobiota bacterium]
MSISPSAIATNKSSSSELTRFEAHKLRWEVAPEIQSLLAEILVNSGQNEKKSRQRSVTRHGVGGKTFYRKNCFHNATWFAPMKYFFKIPASRAEWQLAPRLQKLGIAVVPHLAHGELWTWHGLQESVLITEGPTGFVPLKSIATSVVVQAALGKFLRRLHGNGVFHSDLHISNLLYSPEKNELCLVDLDNMKILPGLSREQRMDNL